MSASAAPAIWPYLDHRTQEELWEIHPSLRREIADLDWLSRRRALTLPESRRLERLMKVAA